MSKELTRFSLQDIQPDTIRQSLDSLHMTSDYAVAKGLRFTDNPYVSNGMLLLLKEARVGIVSGGEAVVEIDLTEYHVTKGMIILLPPDTIVNIRSASSDYALNGTIFLPTISVDEPIVLHPDDDVHQDTMRIYETLCAFCQNHPERRNVIEHLQRAIVDNVCAIQADKKPQQSSLSAGSRGEEIFHKFKVLVSRHDRKERLLLHRVDLVDDKHDRALDLAEFLHIFGVLVAGLFHVRDVQDYVGIPDGIEELLLGDIRQHDIIIRQPHILRRRRLYALAQSPLLTLPFVIDN